MRDNTTIRGETAKAAILREGLRLWADDPAKVTARAIGRALGMTHTGCLYHWPDGIASLRADIAAEAVRIGNIPVVRQLIVAGHPAVSDLDQATRAAYLAGA